MNYLKVMASKAQQCNFTDKYHRARFTAVLQFVLLHCYLISESIAETTANDSHIFVWTT